MNTITVEPTTTNSEDRYRFELTLARQQELDPRCAELTVTFEGGYYTCRRRGWPGKVFASTPTKAVARALSFLWSSRGEWSNRHLRHSRFAAMRAADLSGDEKVLVVG